MVFNTLAFIGLYGGLKYINITDSVVIMNLAPILVGIISSIVYNSEYTKWDAF